MQKYVCPTEEAFDSIQKFDCWTQRMHVEAGLFGLYVQKTV